MVALDIAIDAIPRALLKQNLQTLAIARLPQRRRKRQAAGVGPQGQFTFFRPLETFKVATFRGKKVTVPGMNSQHKHPRCHAAEIRPGD
jgi:hypothetical protein